MKLSGVIAALAAAGGTIEQIKAVVQAAEAEEACRAAEQAAKEDALAAERREKAAAKKRAQRASIDLSLFVPKTDRDSSGQEGTQGDDGGRHRTTGTRGDMRTARDAPAREPAPAEPEPKNPIENIFPPSPPTGAQTPKGVPSHRGTTLPDDWLPKDRHFAKAAEHGQNGGFVETLADLMREWAGANRNRAIARKADWDLTFDGFLRRELDAKGPAKIPPVRAGPPARNEIRDPMVAAAARYING